MIHTVNHLQLIETIIICVSIADCQPDIGVRGIVILKYEHIAPSGHYSTTGNCQGLAFSEIGVAITADVIGHLPLQYLVTIDALALHRCRSVLLAV